MSGYLHFIPEFVLCTNSSLFWFRIANKLSEFRNYLGYNKKCRNPLPWDKLYTHKLPQKKADEPEPEEETDDMPQSGQLDLFGLGDDEEVSE